MAIKNSVKDRFWAKVNKSDLNGGCWLWTGAKNDDGYGVFRAAPGPTGLVYAHRFACALAGRSLRTNEEAGHGLKCARTCVRFDRKHVHPSNRKKNMAQQWEQRRGQRHGGNAKPLSLQGQLPL